MAARGSEGAWCMPPATAEADAIVAKVAQRTRREVRDDCWYIILTWSVVGGRLWAQLQLIVTAE